MDIKVPTGALPAEFLRQTKKEHLGLLDKWGKKIDIIYMPHQGAKECRKRMLRLLREKESFGK